MILYLDSSSLVKLYVDEPHSEAVRAWTSKAEMVSTCRVAFPETVSALTRRFRRGELDEQDFERAVAALFDNWPTYVALDFDELDAGHLVRLHGLRGFDAVHLSSAKLLANQEEPVDLAFSSFDENLNTAASAEGLVVLIP